MKAAIEVTTDEIKAMIAWYRLRQTKPELADLAAAALKDMIVERVLEAALAKETNDKTYYSHHARR